MKKLEILIHLCILLLMAGCNKEVKKEQRPEWIDKPEPGFVGKCATHEKDINEQEQCAYNKALVDIAESKLDSAEFKVSGIIIDKWHDKNAEVMYVLIKEK